MQLTSFKTAAQAISGTSVKQVFFDYRQIANIERVKLYPYILWDLNSWKGAINWADTGHKKEKVSVRVFAVDYWDRASASETDTREAAWDAIRGYFREYCTVLNISQLVQITNLNNMPYEYYEIGLTVDSEIGVAFDVELDLYC
jgi:hypothetical protein